MDKGVVSRTLEGLKDVSLKFVRVKPGAPVNCSFSALRDTLHSDSIYADIAFLDLFNLAEDMLT